MEYLKPQTLEAEQYMDLLNYSPQKDLDANSNHMQQPKCSVCSEISKQPCICKNCSQITCNTCIHQWAVGQSLQCPNCFHLFQVMEDQQSKTNKAEEKECDLHKERLNYHCLTCNLAICTDCAMLSETHKNHCFERLEKVYEEKVQEIRSELEKISHLIGVMTQKGTKLQTNRAEVQNKKQERVKELQTVVEQVTKRLERELDMKDSNILGKQKDLEKNIKLLEDTKIELNERICQSSKTEMVEKSGKILEHLQDLKKKFETAQNENSMSLDFFSEVIPGFESGVFILKDFSFLVKSTEIIYSEPIFANGIQWRLKVYPNGAGTAKDSYVSVFLEMTQGESLPSKYEYKIELLNQIENDGSNSLSKDFTSEFQAGQCWGFHKFIRIDTLEKEGFLVPQQSDMLVFRYHVRALTYYQQCEAQKRYIKSLEEQQRESNQLLEELKKKLESERREKKELMKKVAEEAQNKYQHQPNNGQEEKPVETVKKNLPSRVRSRGTSLEQNLAKMLKAPKQKKEVEENFEVVDDEENSFHEVSSDDSDDDDEDEEETTKESSKEIHSTIIQMPESLANFHAFKEEKLESHQKESVVYVGFAGENLEICIEDNEEDLLSLPISPRKQFKGRNPYWNLDE